MMDLQNNGTINAELFSLGDKIILKIKDDGIGFPENIDLENTNSFGLQLVNLIVNQLRGTIELKRDNGTEFKIKFEELNYNKII